MKRMQSLPAFKKVTRCIITKRARHFCLYMVIALCMSEISFSQNVGIGTTTPNAKAALDIKSTDKGILFPRLTTAQRNAIADPPDGLHIYNKDERCLNYYDSSNKIWNCYCADC